jgi:DNA-binding MarR family transcriptional regulator
MRQDKPVKPPVRQTQADAGRSRAARLVAKTRPRDEGRSFDGWDFQTNSLGYLLRCAQLRAYELFFVMLSAQQLSPARLTALSMIALEHGIDQATLARRLRVQGPSVVKVVDALEHAGLIARESRANDRRRYALRLTDAGRAKLDALRLAMPSYEEELTRPLTAAERAQLLTLLRKIGGNAPERM